MAEALDKDTIMKAACIQAAAIVVVRVGRYDELAVVESAKKIWEQMEKQGYFPGQ